MKTFLALVISTILSVNLFSQSSSPKCNCCSEQQRQFDFWLGEWETYTGDKLAGKNSITLIQDSCILVENWTSSNGTYTGTSYNFYDLQLKQWRQLWIDNNGNHIESKGAYKDGAMVLKSAPTMNPQGKLVINKITWFKNEDGTVRQLWEVSNDKEASWKPVFDGLYKKTK
ncbi:MAG: hypothetical protein AAGK97_12025 [Bacteroidota bacterium]